MKEIHRSNPWASDWLKRYDEEGKEGLRDRTKCGRSLVMSEEISFSIKKELISNSKQGRTTKQVEELIVKKSGIKYHYTHIYSILRKWGFKQKVPRKVTYQHSISRSERDFQKKVTQIFVDKQKLQQETEFTIISFG